LSVDSGPKLDEKPNVKVLKNGPYFVTGGVPIYSMIIECDGTGTPSNWITSAKLSSPESYILCRCGQSTKKPFCDGTHVKINFDGSEVSDNEPFNKMAEKIDGPELILKDAVILCASARFCHRRGDVWNIIHHTDDDPDLRKNVIENCFDCPSGRLVLQDKKTNEILEPDLEKSIGAIEDPSKGVSGPFWIRGGIPVFSADGKLYEIRNRITLCRCGKSTNKPFCDSSHYPEEDREVK